MTTPRRSARHLVRRWWPVALAVPLGAAAGAGYAVVSPPSYSASAYVLVVPQNPGEPGTATNFAQAYGRLAGQPQVLAVAAAETGHTRSELESLVSGTTSPDAPMIEITGTGPRGQEAARTADAVARSLVAFANTSSRDTNVRLVTLAPAAEPDKPTTPSAKLDVAVGAAAGLLLGSLVLMTRRRGGAARDGAEAPEVPEAPAPAGAPAAPEAAEPAGAAPAAAAPATPRPRSAAQTGRTRPKTEARADAKAEPRTESKAGSKTGARTEARAESTPAARTEAKPAARTEAKAGAATAPGGGPEAEPKLPAEEKTAAGSGR
ncbi:Wzz/FepE/Etk N-terminal domain-containing protein [Kitasatospora aureofaciens]|uniref:Wzz/FepE/Etk N-terminal domain-containing protein n=1 Tax=Kitasatospora aureofaciens TaxID=1894 RepID=UPI0037C65933